MQADLLHFAFERLAGKSLHGKTDGLSFLDRCDIALVDLRKDLHVRQVVGDEEELRSRKARGHGLSESNVPLHDDAIDRRGDVRIGQVLPCSIERHPGRFDVGCCHCKRSLAHVKFAFGNETV